MADIKLHDHPEYAEGAKALKLFEDLYEGEHSCLAGNTDILWPHELEKAAKDGAKYREIREARSRYTNLFEPIESTWVNIILSDSIEIPDDVKKLFEGIESDVDGAGHSLETFIREKVAPSYIRYGKVFILTDAPAVEVRTVAEERAVGLRPYFSMLDPIEVHDWQYKQTSGDSNKLLGIRTEYIADLPRASLTDAPQRLVFSAVRELSGANYITTIFVQKQDAQKQKTWELKEAPKVLAGWDALPVAHIVTDPWLKDVAQLCLRLFNLESALDTQMNAQAFQRIMIAGNLDAQAKIAFNEYAVNFLPEGATITIAEPSNPAALQARIDQTVNQIFKVAFNRAHSLPDSSKEAPSADSTRKMKEEQVALAMAAIADIENVMNQAIVHFAKFRGIDDFQGRIKIGRNVSEEDIQDNIQIFQTYADAIRKIPEWYKAHLKRVARREEFENLEKILAQIDGTDFSQPLAATQDLRSKLLGRFGNGGQTDNQVQDPGQ